jgi:hypothetical protein
MLSEIVKRALVRTVTSIGQITHQEQFELNRAVRKGWLSKGKGGPFPNIKTVYAHPGFDFAEDRRRHVEEAMEYAKIDRAMREQRATEVSA